MAKLFLGTKESSPVVKETIYLPKEKFGLTIDNFVGDVDENGTLSQPQGLMDNINFSGVKDISNSGMYYAFYHKQIPSEIVIFEDLEKITGDNALESCFCSSSGVKKIFFPKLQIITGASAFSSCFNRSSVEELHMTDLTEINCNSGFYWLFEASDKIKSAFFPKLKKAIGARVFYDLFWAARELENVDFSNLEEISGESAACYMFHNNTKLKTILLPKLKKLSGASVASRMFSALSSLESLSFPSLVEISGTNPFGTNNGYMFNGSKSLLSVHFRTDMQETIENLPGYSEKFGATNATIYFDL